MKRIMVVGAPGSGKSTLAAKLGEVTGLPVYHMDKIHYKPGWVERSREEKDALTHEVHLKDLWVFEGGHSSTYAERYDRADTLIWLDFPLGLRLFRVLKRSIRYHGKTRPDLADGCPERFDKETIEFIRYIWRTRHTARAKLLHLYEADSPEMQKVRLTDLKSVNQFINEFKN